MLRCAAVLARGSGPARGERQLHSLASRPWLPGLSRQAEGAPHYLAVGREEAQGHPGVPSTAAGRPAFAPQEIFDAGRNMVPEVWEVLDKIKAFSGEWMFWGSAQMCNIIYYSVCGVRESVWCWT